MRKRMWVIALAVVGCAHKKSAPPSMASSIDLAGKHAEYRDWRGQDVCKIDAMSHWSQLEAWNALLTEYLAQTKKTADDPTWTDAEVKTMEDAVANLGPALDGLDSLTSTAPKCENYPKTSGVQDSAKTADELSQQARKRLADAQRDLPRLKEGLALNRWKAEQAEAQKTGRETWCGGKPSADIFYAAQDDHGTTEWHFCDDVKVIAAQGAKPEVHVDEGKKKPKNPKPYLDAASKYPASDVQHAPKPGEKAASGEKTDKPES
jgi:hypothetical protein